MKKIICLTLSLMIVLSTFVNVNAMVSKMDYNKDLGNYMVYKIDFNANSTYTVLVNGNIKNNINENAIGLQQKLNVCEKMVKDINLESNGFGNLEKSLLDEINSLRLKDNITLNSYEIHIPDLMGVGTSSISDPIYFGSYNGFTVQAAYSVYNYSEYVQANGTLLDRFVNGIVDIVMGTVSLKYSMPFTVFLSLCNLSQKEAVQTYGMTRQEVNVPFEHTTRYLLIEDKLNQYYENYVLLYQDEAAIYRFEIITITTSPYVPTFVKYGDIGQDNTIDFYNAQRAMQRLYNRYMSGNNEIIQDKLPDVIVKYQ